MDDTDGVGFHVAVADNGYGVDFCLQLLRDSGLIILTRYGRRRTPS